MLIYPQVAQARNMSIGEHRHCCVTFKIQRFVWEKTYRFCNLRKRKDFNKKQLTLLKMCVTSLLCGPRADLWPFYGFLCKRFSVYIKVYQGGHRLIVVLQQRKQETSARRQYAVKNLKKLRLRIQNQVLTMSRSPDRSCFRRRTVSPTSTTTKKTITTTTRKNK